MRKSFHRLISLALSRLNWKYTFNPHNRPASLALLFLSSLKLLLLVRSTKIRHLCFVQLALRSPAQKHSQCNGWLVEQQRSPNQFQTWASQLCGDVRIDDVTGQRYT